MKDRFTTYGYSITTDPQFQNKRYGITPQLVKLLGSLGREIKDKNNKTIIGKLTELIILHPTVPQLKNYLSGAYSVQGDFEKAKEVNRWLLSEHPDYLFAKINAASTLIDNEEYEKVTDLLGEAMEIKALYPDRDLFHLGEVTGFYKMAVRYFASKGEMGLAENRLEVLKDIAPDHPDTKDAESFIFEMFMLRGMEKLEKEAKLRIYPDSFKSVPESGNSTPPHFNHSEIEQLYKFDLHISHDILKEIIALPRETLIADLEKILSDAVDRYNYFSELEYDEETHSFVLHAMFLLGEINAEESLPKILSFLEYDCEFVDYWIGEHKTETIWQSIYRLGLRNSDQLKQFLVKPGIDTYNKTAVSVALCQIALHHPEMRNEILAIYQDVFTIFSEADLNDNLIDSELLGLAIGDSIDCKLHELLPIIKVLYDKGYVSLSINGDYDEVEKEFGANEWYDHKMELYNIFDLYNDVLSTWDGYKEHKQLGSYKPYAPAPAIPQQAVSEKIGRNEPCPCGSGKKYKKCCMNKN
jgi:tetratricopeptide (TPR) repeat protein